MESPKKKRGRRERRAFSHEFKAEAVRLAAERGAGVSLAHVARQLDVRVGQLRDWMQEYGEAPAETRKPGRPPGETIEQEVRRLRRQVAVLQQEKAFAKKVAAYFAKESR
jgi:transposase-like protein